jgi:hypothetical protein
MDYHLPILATYRHKLDLLEQRNADLEERITELEKTTLKAPESWQAGKTFWKNDTIQRDGSLWQCVESHGAGAAFDHSHWKLLIKRGKDGRDLRDAR